MTHTGDISSVSDFFSYKSVKTSYFIGLKVLSIIMKINLLPKAQVSAADISLPNSTHKRSIMNMVILQTLNSLKKLGIRIQDCAGRNLVLDFGMAGCMEMLIAPWSLLEVTLLIFTTISERLFMENLIKEF